MGLLTPPEVGPGGAGPTATGGVVAPTSGAVDAASGAVDTAGGAVASPGCTVGAEPAVGGMGSE